MKHYLERVGHCANSTWFFDSKNLKYINLTLDFEQLDVVHCAVITQHYTVKSIDGMSLFEVIFEMCNRKCLLFLAELLHLVDLIFKNRTWWTRVSRLRLRDVSYRNP